MIVVMVGGVEYRTNEHCVVEERLLREQMLWGVADNDKIYEDVPAELNVDIRRDLQCDKCSSHGHDGHPDISRPHLCW